MPFLNRRKFIAALAAAPVVISASKSAKAADVDVAIVGAGAAGLAAGQALRAAGRSVVIFEARDRVGGRAYTVNEQLGQPFDMGGHWIHLAHDNPYVPIAKAAGLRLTQSHPDRVQFYESGAVLPKSEHDAIKRAIEKAHTYGYALSKLPSDRPLSAAYGDDRHAQLAMVVPRLEMATEMANISLADYAQFPAGDDLQVEGGFGALVARGAAGLDIRLNSPVTSIDHGQSGSVTLEGPFGKVRARACIVTLSTGLLAANAIKFTPELPKRTQQAFHDLPLGLLDKIGMRLETPLTDFPEYSIDAGILLRSGAHVLHLSEDRTLATVLVGGDLAHALEKEGAKATEAFGLEVLGAIAGSRAKAVATLTTAWAADAFARGSYTYCRVGATSARKDYETPVADRLFFAGEAAPGDHKITIGGAHNSGIKTAKAIVKLLA